MMEEANKIKELYSSIDRHKDSTDMLKVPDEVTGSLDYLYSGKSALQKEIEATNKPKPDDLYKCNHCSKVVPFKSLQFRHTEDLVYTTKNGHRVFANVHYTEGLCEECFVNLKIVDKYFNIAWFVIDLLIAIVAVSLVYFGVISDIYLLVGLICMAAVPIFGNNILKQLYINLDSHFKSKHSN